MQNEDRLKDLEERMKKVEELQNEDSPKIDQMYRGLFGDEKIHYEGLIESNKRHTKWLEKIDPIINDFIGKIEKRKVRNQRLKASIKWIVIVGSGLTAWIMSLFDLLKKFPWVK